MAKHNKKKNAQKGFMMNPEMQAATYMAGKPAFALKPIPPGDKGKGLRKMAGSAEGANQVKEFGYDPATAMKPASYMGNLDNIRNERGVITPSAMKQDPDFKRVKIDDLPTQGSFVKTQNYILNDDVFKTPADAQGGGDGSRFRIYGTSDNVPGGAYKLADNEPKYTAYSYSISNMPNTSYQRNLRSGKITGGAGDFYKFNTGNQKGYSGTYNLEGDLLGEFFRQTGGGKRHKNVKSSGGFGTAQYESSYAPINPRSGEQYNFVNLARSSDYFNQLKRENRNLITNQQDLDFALKQPKSSQLYKKAQFTLDMEKSIGRLADIAKFGDIGVKPSSEGIVMPEIKTPKPSRFAPAFDPNNPPKPKKEKKTKGPGLFKQIGEAIGDLNLFRPARYKGARIVGKRRSKSGPSFKYRGGRGGGRRRN